MINPFISKKGLAKIKTNLKQAVRRNAYTVYA